MNSETILSIYEFQNRYNYLPNPVITKEHEWMLIFDTKMWICLNCLRKIINPVEVEKEIFDKAFPILVSDVSDKFISPVRNSLCEDLVSVKCSKCEIYQFHYQNSINLLKEIPTFYVIIAKLKSLIEHNI